jgi:hypothetical protein
MHTRFEAMSGKIKKSNYSLDFIHAGPRLAVPDPALPGHTKPCREHEINYTMPIVELP